MKRFLEYTTGQKFVRDFSTSTAIIDRDKRIFRATISTDSVIDRGFYYEKLVHDRSAIDISRLSQEGISVLFNHDLNQIVGSVRELNLNPHSIEAILQLSTKTDLATQLWDLITESHLGQISVGYSINDTKERGNQVDITSWRLNECSLVSVSADQGASIRSMNNSINTNNNQSIMENTKTNIQDQKDQIINEERQRVRSIVQYGQELNCQETEQAKYTLN